MYDQLYRFNANEAGSTYSIFALFCGGLLGSYPVQVFLLADVVGADAIFGNAHVFSNVPETYPMELQLASRPSSEGVGHMEPFFVSSGELAKFLSAISLPTEFTCLSLPEDVQAGVATTATHVLHDFGPIGNMRPPLAKAKDAKDDQVLSFGDQIEQSFLRAMGGNRDVNPIYSNPVLSGTDTEEEMSDGERIMRAMLGQVERVYLDKPYRKHKKPDSSDDDSWIHDVPRKLPPPDEPPPLPPPIDPPPPLPDDPHSGSDASRAAPTRRTDFELVRKVIERKGRWLYIHNAIVRNQTMSLEPGPFP